MAFYDYTKTPHPNGNYCYRVTGPGDVSKYFNRHDGESALAYHTKMIAKRKKMKLAKLRLSEAASKNDGRVKYDTSTGVSGIRMRIYTTNSRTPACLLVLFCNDSNGELANSSSVVNSENLDSVWRGLLIMRAKVKGIKKIPKHWRESNPPTGKRFNKLIKQMRKDGRDVGDLVFR